MSVYTSKIYKLIRAFEIKGQVYLFNRVQFYSEKAERVCTAYKLSHRMSVEKYNLLHPEKKKNPKKYNYVIQEVMKSYSEIDILKYLAEIYKEGG